MKAAAEAILKLLAEVPEASAAELARRAGVSQPTLSRHVRALGDRVLRLGRARATRYARTRPVAGIASHLPLFTIEEDGRPNERGTLHLLWGGRHAIEWRGGRWERFEGLPPFVIDMAPQGFLGREVASSWPELDLPPRTVDWTDDHRLIAVARRGEDAPGNVIVGAESLDRFFAEPPALVGRSEFPALALRAAMGEPGSSAGGEWPKFTALTERGHVLVKYADAGEDPVSRRWRDLLVCEHLATRVLREAGLQAVEAETFELGGMRFLESVRFDRAGTRGRRAVLTLYALDNEYVGFGHGWSRTARALRPTWHLADEDLRRVRWLDVFGASIANTDRHLGNLAFFVREGRGLRLAPAYDMLPMLWAPERSTLVDRPFSPPRPNAETLDVWDEASRWALVYWQRVSGCTEITDELRRHAERYARSLASLMRAVPV